MSAIDYLAFLDEARRLFAARQRRFGEIRDCRL